MFFEFGGSQEAKNAKKQRWKGDEGSGWTDLF